VKVRELDIGGRRCVRVGSYVLEGDGEPEPRVFVAVGWQGMGALPFVEQTVDLPAAALPQLIDALASLKGEA
jgi:hypothetical protein